MQPLHAGDVRSRACSYWNTVLSAILLSLPFQETECTYAKTMTTKSSQFHGSRRKVNSPTQKPLARILTSDSKVYIPVKVYLDTRIQWDIKYEENTTPCKSLFFLINRRKASIGVWLLVYGSTLLE